MNFEDEQKLDVIEGTIVENEAFSLRKGCDCQGTSSGPHSVVDRVLYKDKFVRGTQVPPGADVLFYIYFVRFVCDVCHKPWIDLREQVPTMHAYWGKMLDYE